MNEHVFSIYKRKLMELSLLLKGTAAVPYRLDEMIASTLSKLLIHQSLMVDCDSLMLSTLKKRR